MNVSRGLNLYVNYFPVYFNHIVPSNGSIVVMHFYKMYTILNWLARDMNFFNLLNELILYGLTGHMMGVRYTITNAQP